MTRRISEITASMVLAGLLAGVPVIGTPAQAAAAGGSALSWGSDSSGQLGDGGGNTSQPSPVPVNGLGPTSATVAVAGGGGHSLALRSDGSVVAWGLNSSGQVGDGGFTSTQHPSPVAVAGLGAGSGVVALAAGADHSLALRADGSVLAWGNDLAGQLGDGGSTQSMPEPVAVSGLGAGSGMVAIAAGHQHSLALRADGSVLAWGADYSGQLGDGGENETKTAPVQVSGLGPGSGVVAVSAGGSHSVAVRSDGSVLSWGNNGNGELGIGAASNGDFRAAPVGVSGFGPGSGAKAIAAGGGHNLVLRADGAVLGWGSDYFGQVGDGRFFVNLSTPVFVTGLGPGSGVVGLGAGDTHSLAVRADGSVLAWGDDTAGQVGEGGGNGFVQATPVAVSGLGPGSGVATVDGGGRHSLAAGPLNRPTFAPLSPFRIWDSRMGPGPIGSLTAGQSRELLVVGVGGVPVSGVDAVVLNVTAPNPTAGTFITAWPTGESRPQASNLNVPAFDSRPNLVTVKVGAGGKVSFYNDAGSTDLIADIAGWYGPTGGHRYTPLSPARVWDSRFGPGPVGRVGAGQSRDLTVTGTAGIPATGVTAVVLNLTAVNPSTHTFVTAWPTGEARPLASNVNLPAGDTRPNLVTVKVGAGGQVSFYNAASFDGAGSVDLVVDVAGYFSNSGSSFTSVSPGRMWDTRFGPGPAGRVGPGQSRDLAVTGLGVPGVGATAVMLNVTVVSFTADTYVTAWPAGEARPLASNLNVPVGDTRANLVVVKAGPDGRVSFYNDSGTVDVIVDVAGWYGLPGA